MSNTNILIGDAFTVLKTLPDDCVDCCVTSPPYFGLRDYGIDGQIGLESNVGEYVSVSVTFVKNTCMGSSADTIAVGITETTVIAAVKIVAKSFFILIIFLL